MKCWYCWTIGLLMVQCNGGRGEKQTGTHMDIVPFWFGGMALPWPNTHMFDLLNCQNKKYFSLMAVSIQLFVENTFLTSISMVL